MAKEATTPNQACRENDTAWWFIKYSQMYLWVHRSRETDHWKSWISPSFCCFFFLSHTKLL